LCAWSMWRGRVFCVIADFVYGGAGQAGGLRSEIATSPFLPQVLHA
jgi:hypothetical protein